ncbi:MAG: YkgJ family cysteine cluster protein [Desulfobacter sp.]|nr:MAG: YkgJ family cysteine cluster protein [Desulfobacter sp.]
MKGPAAGRSRELLAAHMEKARSLLDDFLENHGVSLPVLGKAMEEFTHTVFDLPEETACQAGCAHCCHLRVGLSIPELLVIFYELQGQATPEGLVYFRSRIQEILSKGDTLTETFWHESRTPCPFLDDRRRCLIYAIRPFSCRAYHSTDEAVCRQGFEQGREVRVPCFPLYRACTDMYSSVFIKVLADKGFPSFQVGLVKGLDILFSDDTAARRWLAKEDVFSGAGL